MTAGSYGPHPGLCVNCAHARRVHSARGSLFWLCERSHSDRRFPRYPSLPVLRCTGFERVHGAENEPPGAL